jgi:hypothetical protein
VLVLPFLLGVVGLLVLVGSPSFYPLVMMSDVSSLAILGGSTVETLVVYKQYATRR